jgi:uncharacterized alkaline shock family protein YloU
MATSTPSAAAVARVAAAAAAATPGVLGLDGGVVGEVATYGDGGRVEGVRVRLSESLVTLQLVVEYRQSLSIVVAELRRRIREAIARELPGLTIARIDVHVADVRPAPQALPAGSAPPAFPATAPSPEAGR